MPTTSIGGSCAESCMKRTMSTALANIPFASPTYSTAGGAGSDAPQCPTKILNSSPTCSERRICTSVSASGDRSFADTTGRSADRQLLADLPQAGGGRVVEGRRGGLHGLALDEVLAGDAGDVGRRREVDRGERALL